MSLRSLTVHSVGFVCSNDSASTSSGVSLSPIFVSASRTARCTVTAASYWFSLLSRLTRLRLSTMLMVPPAAAAPPVAVLAAVFGPAQLASTGAKSRPAPAREPNLRMERRECWGASWSDGETRDGVCWGIGGLLVERGLYLDCASCAFG